MLFPPQERLNVVKVAWRRGCVYYAGNLKDLGQPELHIFPPPSTSGSTYISVTLKIEVARSSEASKKIYCTTQCNAQNTFGSVTP